MTPDPGEAIMQDGRAEAEEGRFWPHPIPTWIRTLGMLGWMVAGLAAGVAALGYVFSAAASIMVPLVMAFVIGVVAYPVVETLGRWRIPHALGALIVLLLLGGIIVLIAWVTTAGIINQWPLISANIQSGVESTKATLESWGVDAQLVRTAAERVQASAGATASTAVSGILAAVSSGLSGVLALFFGLFVGAALLYYVLSDFPRIGRYIDCHLGLPEDLGHGVTADAAEALTGYFRGTTLSGLVVAVVIGIGLLLLGVPLALPIALVTFLTCYIPFFGAIVSGAFAFLVALGAKDLPTALIVLAIVLIAQNLLQTIVNARLMGTSLNLHPLVVLVVTMLGGIFGGLLGAALAAPVVAIALRATARIKRHAQQVDAAT
jgi:predicted PurR-regulated permease PerM